MIKTIKICALLKVIMLTKVVIALKDQESDILPNVTVVEINEHLRMFPNISSDNVTMLNKDFLPSKPRNPRSFVDFGNELNEKYISVTFRWNQPELKNGMIQKYRVHYWFENLEKNKSAIDILATQRILQYKAYNLKPDTTYYFKVQAYNEFGAGPYTDLINVSTTHENPVPLLWLVLWNNELKVWDIDLQIKLTLLNNVDQIVYSALERKIYWINVEKELMTSDFDPSTIEIKPSHKKITNLKKDTIFFCIDWVTRNLYWLQYDNYDHKIMKLDLTLWQNGIKLEPDILLENDKNYHFYYFNILPSKGYVYGERKDSREYVTMQSYSNKNHLNILLSNENNVCFCESETISDIYIDYTNIDKPLLYSRRMICKDLIVTDIYDQKCNKILWNDIEIDFNALTIDKTNIYLYNRKVIYILEKKYVNLRSKENALKYVQNFTSLEQYQNTWNKNDIRRIIALGNSVQPYPPTICLIPNITEFQFLMKASKVINYLEKITDNIVMNIPEPVLNVGCENYNSATIIYIISVSRWTCLNNDIDKFEKIYVTDKQRFRIDTLKNSTSLSMYTLKLRLSNFYIDELSRDLKIDPNVTLNTTVGWLNAPEIVTVQVLMPPLATVYWMPPKELNCALVNYEVHWVPNFFPNDNESYVQFIDKPERTEDGKFFMATRLLQSGNEYTVYVRVYPANFSDLFNDSSRKSFNTYSQPSTPYNLPILIVIVISFVVAIINVYYFYCPTCRQRNISNRGDITPPIITDNEPEATSNRIPLVNLSDFSILQRNQLYSQVEDNPDISEWQDELNDIELYMITIKEEQITRRKLLGEGAFGEVFQGTVRNLEKPGITPVAIKTLRENASLQQKKEFLQEAKLMSRFCHKHVLRLLGICIDKDSPWLITELMEGGDLLKYLRESRILQPSDSNALRLQDLLAMCEDVARGCCYLEKLRYVHRDLACRNCLISTRNRENRIVKIGDFGLARDIYQIDYYRMKNGRKVPVRWMAPESLVPNGIFTSKTDVWTFGVLMWEVMSLGKQPYSDKNNSEVMRYVPKGGKLSKPLNCPLALYQLMQRCWDAPNKRPTFKSCLENIVTLRDNIEDAILIVSS